MLGGVHISRTALGLGFGSWIVAQLLSYNKESMVDGCLCAPGLEAEATNVLWDVATNGHCQQ